MLLMGKSTISTGSFSIATLNYQRVDVLNSEVNDSIERIYLMSFSV